MMSDVEPAFDAFADAEPKKSGAGLWIALGSLVVIGAAAAIVYFAVLRAPRRGADGAGTGTAAAGTVDGGAVATAADAGTAAIDAGSAVDVAAMLAEARDQLGRDTAPALIAADAALAAAPSDAVALGLRARATVGQAQLLEDEAAFASDGKTADKVREERRKLTLAALGLAQQAQKAAGADAARAVVGHVAMADVLRLQGKPAKEVRRYLELARAGKPSPDDARELALAEAQLALREKDYPAAAKAVAQAEASGGGLDATGDVRARWLTARLAAATGKNDDAKAACEAILAAVADHAGARALLAKVSGVDATDPMPPEVGTGSGSGAGSGSGSGSGSSTGSGSGVTVPSGSGDPYDRLVAKADKLAEVDCGQAMPYYVKALDERPAGVEALIGMGYCHIDAKQFASAQSKFRTALALSPRNKDALRGVAEAYQQQGRADLAIEAYKRYLDVYPDDERIKRQLERLTGGGSGPTPPENGSGSGSGSGSAPPDKPADPPPPPSGGSDTPPTTP